MAEKEKKDLKLNIKNLQIAGAIKLSKIKENLALKKIEKGKNKETKKKSPAIKSKAPKDVVVQEELEEKPRRKARTKSVFEKIEEENIEPKIEEPVKTPESQKPIEIDQKKEETVVEVESKPEKREILGPTGKHINDLLSSEVIEKKEEKQKKPDPIDKEKKKKTEDKKFPAKEVFNEKKTFKDFQDIKPTHRQSKKSFSSRDRRGLGESEDDSRWRKRRASKHQMRPKVDLTIRPTSISIRIPVSIKDLAQEMKIKASQLISKLFLQGIVVTINDILEDETTILLLGEEFGCTISIDTSEEERIRITDKTILKEIQDEDPSTLTTRAPIVTFMGHIDHGKTSLIDYIRKSNIIQGEAGSITQHIGAFLCKTKVGEIAILDTPGHEAFSAMRARGAEVTDIVVLVIAGDEGIRKQTEEAIDHAKAAGVTIIIALNKSDRPNFDAEKVYRELADRNLLPEAWGGQTITVNCSAKTGEGVDTLLEMLALQSEILELKANPNARARGTVLESELHKGMGLQATILVQNGTLRIGDAVVFGEHGGRVKTMRDEHGNSISEAPPSTPVEITGISGLPEAGVEFIVVSTEKEAKEIAEARRIGKRSLYLAEKKKGSLQNILQQAQEADKKLLKIVLKADVQGSLEALKVAFAKIESDKVDIEVISHGVGEISESDVLLAAASKAIIIGFHTQVESHAEELIKQHSVHTKIHDIIYHAIDDVKSLMENLLDKVAEETDRGKAKVQQTFKASQLGTIAGCLVSEGTIHRNHYIRVVRDDEIVWKGAISSLKRVKEDVRQVQKGVECGILLSNFNDIQEGDVLEAYEVTYSSQKL